MKIAIIGADGQLGYDLCRVIDKSEQIPLTIRDIDITDPEQCEKVLSKHSPDIVINTAAYNKVDEAENDQAAAYLVNADGAKNVASACKKLSAPMVHFSTDYVFDGTKNEPYVEDDLPNPQTIYGKSKLEGERLVAKALEKYFIIRTSGLFGKAGCMGKGGSNFVENMIKRAQQGESIKVVKDEILSPTYSLDLARKVSQIVRTNRFGLYHITNNGQCSWYEFAQKIFELAKIKFPIQPVTSAEYITRALRPKYSVLKNRNLGRIGMDDLRTWDKALEAYFSER